MSQTHEILEYLKTGESISPMSALLHFGCMRLSERIREIEKQGYVIERKWLSYHSEKKNKIKRVMSYRLQNPYLGL